MFWGALMSGQFFKHFGLLKKANNFETAGYDFFKKLKVVEINRRFMCPLSFKIMDIL